MAKAIHATELVVKIGQLNIRDWETEARTDPDYKFRYCAHLAATDIVHEMFITLTNRTIVPVHKHRGKSEAFHWIDGYADVVLYSDEGEIIDRIPMGPPGDRQYFYYRLNSDTYHTLDIISPVIAFHETTPGPWHRDDLILAPWWTPPAGWSR